MTESIPTSKAHKVQFWIGWGISILLGIFFLSGAFNAWRAAPMVIAGTTHLGYSPDILKTLGALEAAFIILFLIPRTAVLGAILLTAYYGGAVASHMRIGERNFIAAIVFGIVTWIALFLRNPRARAALGFGGLVG